ncbi:MAG TPA: hypothetical protein VL486_11630 [Verrucomicrobiae bacterium]|nr:hypothetical protein [Verrucomicrobiae bacterium]
MIDGLPCPAFGREHREKPLQFVRVKPQTVAPGAFVEGQGRRASVFHLDFPQRLVTARAEVRAAIGQDAALLLEAEEGIVGSCTRAFQERFEFACIQPQPAAPVTRIDFDLLEMQDEKRDVALWANSNH